jgi:hypothetical protein
MSVGGIANRADNYAVFAEDDTATGTFTSLAAEIALLVLENQEAQKHLEREQLAAAREDFSAALADEVEALKASADASFRGALFQASMAVGSSALGLWGSARTVNNPWQDKLGSGLGQLSQPLGVLVSNNYGQADAKSAEGEETAAKWRMEDARDATKDAAAVQDKALDWLRQMSDRDAATAAAILSNKV